MDLIGWYFQVNQRRKEFLLSLIEKEENMIVDKNPVRKKRKSKPRKDHESTIFAEYLKDDQLMISNSETSKNFRRRFRVPPNVFEMICNLWNLSPTAKSIGSTDAFRRYAAPIKFKIMSVLRVLLGRAVSFDECFELSKISEETS